MNYQDNEEKYDEARELLKENLSSHSRIKEVQGAGVNIDIRAHDESNSVFGTSEKTRENWTKGDTSTSNESFRVQIPSVIKEMLNSGALKFIGVNCVIYDHGEGKGERDFGLWLRFKFDPELVLEEEKDGNLPSLITDPWKL